MEHKPVQKNEEGDRNMKNTHSPLVSILLATATFPLIAVLVLLRFLPDEIPAHFDINMNVDRWGSKYEILIMPAVILIQSVCMYISSCRSIRHDSSGNNRKVLLITGITANLMFAAITAFQVTGAVDLASLNKISSDFSLNIVFILIGAAMVVIGNFMPKCRLNSTIGLRTQWSMANEEVWSRCQRFGGVLSVICGILMMALSAAVENGAALIAVNLIILTAMVIASVSGSKRIYDKVCGDKR